MFLHFARWLSKFLESNRFVACSRNADCVNGQQKDFSSIPKNRNLTEHSEINFAFVISIKVCHRHEY